MSDIYRYIKLQDEKDARDREPTDAVIRAQHIPHACSDCEGLVEMNRGDASRCYLCEATAREAADRVEGIHAGPSFSRFPKATRAARNWLRGANRRRY